jgi:hypothetical protein
MHLRNCFWVGTLAFTTLISIIPAGASTALGRPGDTAAQFEIFSPRAGLYISKELEWSALDPLFDPIAAEALHAPEAVPRYGSFDPMPGAAAPNPGVIDPHRVPEPMTYFLVGSSLLLFRSRSRRRRNIPGVRGSDDDLAGTAPRHHAS